MKLQIAVRSKSERTTVEAQPFFIRMKDGLFAVVVPAFDDWSRTVDFDLSSADAVLRVEGSEIVIVFPEVAARDEFTDWLGSANSKAKQGYRTMWP